MPDAILFWNNVALDAVARDHTGKETTNPDGTKTFVPPVGEQGGPTRTSRALAIVHLAMYDAFNAIERENGRVAYKAYLPNLPTPPKTSSQEAAASTAAFVTLNALYTKDEEQKKAFLNAYQRFMSTVVASPQEIDDGNNFGHTVARMMLSERTNDGSAQNVAYAQQNVPGYHRPDPLDPSQGFLTPHWGYVKPFAIGDVRNLKAGDPPKLGSLEYAKDFNEVKKSGALNSSTRTIQQTTIGLYWAYDGAQKLGVPPRLYNQIAYVIAEKQNNSQTGKPNTQAENARLFALLNMALADAGIQCWYWKYHYNYWRPVIGIREADKGYGPTGNGDGNPKTKGDPYWQPFGAPRTNPPPGKKNFTPNFPSYPAGHATFGSAAFNIIKHFYGNNDNISFEFVSEEMNNESLDANGTVRTKYHGKYDRLSKAIKDNADSRIYIGVHWRFDCDSANKSGKEIAKYIYDNFLIIPKTQKPQQAKK
jgi:hypothetical protein